MRAGQPCQGMGSTTASASKPKQRTRMPHLFHFLYRSWHSRPWEISISECARDGPVKAWGLPHPPLASPNSAQECPICSTFYIAASSAPFVCGCTPASRCRSCHHQRPTRACECGYYRAIRNQQSENEMCCFGSVLEINRYD